MPHEFNAADDLSTFFDVAQDMLCIRDMAGRFVKVSRSWTTVLGYAVEELEGAPLLPLVHPDDLAATQGQMRRIDTTSEVVGFINRYRHRDGHYVPLEWRARLSGDRVFAVARDVTARLALEAEQAAARAAAEAANQAKTDFLANMSHEIRTPLNGVIGVVDALSRTALTPAQQEMVGLVQTSSATLERLVSDILDISKIEAGLLDIETCVFDLQAELQGPLDTNRLRAQAKGLAYHVEFGDQARGDFLGDAIRIKQVLGNLLSNAVKFTAQGEIAIRIEAQAPAGPGGPTRIVMEVGDTGVGFDAAAAKTLFQRFSQADATITRLFGGTGLGLSICKALVEMMGGEVAAHSQPGRGSLFRVVLPLARARPLAEYDAGRRDHGEAAQAAQAGAEAAVDASPLHGAAPLRVLLAEDHPINQRVVQLILAPYGAAITVVENGLQALAAFQADPYDLVLMDMQMPVMDGLAATRAIRQYEREASPPPARTPILMLSANAMAQHQSLALAAGADLHVAKPITAAALIAGIDQALAAGVDPAARPHANEA